MPDRDSAVLDVRLARGRAELLDAIDQPPLSRIHARAAARQRRRRTVGAGTALATVALAAALVVRPLAGTQPAPPPLAEPTPTAPVYTAEGITINGLTGSGVLEIPGDIVDVEFTDPDHGWVLAACQAGQSCPATVARTDDGGLTWQATRLPGNTSGRGGLDLVASPGGRPVVTGDNLGYTSDDGGRTWRATTAADTPTPLPARPGDLLRLGPYPQPGRCGGTIEIWQPGFLRGATTTGQPGITVCWVAPVPATDGAWWAGGTAGRQAALAVTRDGGRTWRTVPLEAGATGVTSVEMTTLGSHAYAVVLGPDRAITALFHSADGGRTFTRTRGADSGVPRALAGALVPLLDGRLLVAGTDRRWYVSTDDGATFTRAEGTLPAVGRLARTSAGYVAYDLFGGGWAAYSNDGSTWRKLQIN